MQCALDWCTAWENADNSIVLAAGVLSDYVMLCVVFATWPVRNSSGG